MIILNIIYNKRSLFLFFMAVFFLMSNNVLAQKVNPNGYNKFTYPDGSISSEGNMKDGKPVGFWKSYYPDGKLKTSGNRKNNLLDSIWKFYDREGFLIEIIDYKNNVKSGYNKKFKVIKDSVYVNNVLISKELYIDDEKNGKSYYYDDEGRLQKTIEFEKNYKNGYEKHFDTLGNVILIIKYSYNNITNSERLNRKDKFGNKKGIWKSFYTNEKLHTYANYLNDTLNGYFREYNTYGELIRSEFYKMGVKQDLSEEEHSEKEIIVKKEFYNDGKVKFSGTFNKDKPVGVHRYYDKSGIITESKTYTDEGTLDALGIVDKEGKKQGEWKFLYSNEEIKSVGEYSDNKKTGKWTYYYIGGKIEQEGIFIEGKPEGIWKWYYENGNLRRTGKFDNGRETGFFYELTEEGDTLSKGNFIAGLKSGEWNYSVNDHKMKGKYASGKQEGIWKHYYADGTLKYEGNFIDNYKDGKHKDYYPDGKISLISEYSMGNKVNKWKKYDSEGNLITLTEYRGGKKYKIDGQKIKEN